MAYRIPILLGTARTGRKSERVAHYLHLCLSEHSNVETEIIDLLDYPFPLMENRMNVMEEIPDNLKQFSVKLQQADALIIVAPEYKNSFPGTLKNALDYMDPGIFKQTPIAICTVSSGGFGGISCLTQLRLVCLAMGGLPIPEKLPISKVNDLFDEQGNAVDPRLREKTDHFLTSLLWYTAAMVNQRKLQP